MAVSWKTRVVECESKAGSWQNEQICQLKGIVKRYFIVDMFSYGY